MNNKEYVEKVNSGNFEGLEVKVPVDSSFIDERGSITNMWLGNSGSATIITSKKGSKRASHYHLSDWHCSFIVSGSIKYTEAEIDGSNKREYVFTAGEAFLSPPNKWHLMEFPEDTVFVTMNGIKKDHEGYENTVVRKDY